MNINNFHKLSSKMAFVLVYAITEVVIHITLCSDTTHSSRIPPSTQPCWVPCGTYTWETFFIRTINLFNRPKDSWTDQEIETLRTLLPNDDDRPNEEKLLQ